MKHLWLSIVMLMVAQCSSFAGGDTVQHRPHITDTVIPEFSVTNASVDDVIQKLWEDRIRVCYERQDQAATGSITMSLVGTTCTEVLQNLVKQDPDYKFDIDKATGLPNVFPKTGSVLDYKLDSYIIDHSDIASAVGDRDHQLKFRDHRVGLFSIGFEPDDFYLHVSIDMKSTTARACLDALIAKGKTIRWEVRFYKNGFNGL